MSWGALDNPTPATSDAASSSSGIPRHYRTALAEIALGLLGAEELPPMVGVAGVRGIRVEENVHVITCQTLHMNGDSRQVTNDDVQIV